MYTYRYVYCRLFVESFVSLLWSGLHGLNPFLCIAHVGTVPYIHDISTNIDAYWTSFWSPVGSR